MTDAVSQKYEVACNRNENVGVGVDLVGCSTARHGTCAFLRVG